MDTEDIAITCPSCGEESAVSKSDAGQTAICPNCNGEMIVQAAPKTLIIPTQKPAPQILAQKPAPQIPVQKPAPQIPVQKPAPQIPVQKPAPQIPAEIAIACPRCGEHSSVEGSDSGQKAVCPHCSGEMTVPGEPVKPTTAPIRTLHSKRSNPQLKSTASLHLTKKKNNNTLFILGGCAATVIILGLLFFLGEKDPQKTVDAPVASAQFQESNAISDNANNDSVEPNDSDLNKGIVAYYSFNGNANDGSGKNNHATLKGNNKFEANIGGKDGAVRLIGDRSLYYAGGGYVDLPAFDSSFDQGFSMSFWTKDELIGGNPVGEEHYLHFMVSDQVQIAIGLHNNSDTPYLFWSADARGNNQEGGRITYPIDNLNAFSSKWKHLALSYTPGLVVAFLNGQKIGKIPVTLSGFPLAYSAFGRHWWNNGTGSSARMDFLLDEARFYNRSLSDEEIAALFAHNKAGVIASIGNVNEPEVQPLPKEVATNTLQPDVEDDAIIEEYNDLINKKPYVAPAWAKALESMLFNLENPSLAEAQKVVNQLNDYAWETKKGVITSYIHDTIVSEYETAGGKIRASTTNLVKAEALKAFKMLLPSTVKAKQAEFENAKRLGKSKNKESDFTETSITLPVPGGKQITRKFTIEELNLISNDAEIREKFDKGENIEETLEGEKEAVRLADLIKSVFSADYAVDQAKEEELRIEKLALERDSAARGWRLPSGLGSQNLDLAFIAEAKARKMREDSAAMMEKVRAKLSAALREADVLLNEYYEKEHRRLTVTFYGILDSINQKSLHHGDFVITVSADTIEALKNLDRNREEWTASAIVAENSGNYENAYKFYTKIGDDLGRRRNAAKLAKELESNGLYGSAIEYYEIAGAFAKSKKLRAEHPELLNEAFAVLDKEELYNKAVKAVVRISYSFRSGDKIYNRHGTGFFFKRGGHILTNNHVIEDSNGDFLVQTHDERTYRGTILTRTKFPDLAVVQINLQEHDVIQFGHEEEIKIGTKAMLLGFPQFDRPTATANAGMISNTSSKDYQLDITANNGNSGGPVIDYRGRLLGVLTWGVDGVIKTFHRFNFAIKVETVRNWLEERLGADFVMD